MKSKWAFTAVVGLAVLCSGSLMALPTEDCAKVQDTRLESEVTSKFSSLYGPSAPGHHGQYGAFEEASRILKEALRHSEHGYSSYDKIQTLERALRDARRVCENGAEKFGNLLGLIDRCTKDVMNFEDKLASMRAGVRHLMNSQPTKMSRDILRLGLAMTRPAMGNHFSATQMMDVVLRAASRHASADDKQWASLLSFAQKAGNNLYNFQSKYALQTRVARAIVEARPGEAIFLKALAQISEMNLSNSFDQYNVIITGLRQYAQDVPAENHRQAVQYLIAVGDIVMDKTSVVRMYRSIMGKLVGLNFETPGFRVILRAGAELSNSPFLSDYDRCSVASKAIQQVMNLRVPPYTKDTLRQGLREADHTYDFGRKLYILRDCMQRAVR